MRARRVWWTPILLFLCLPAAHAASEPGTEYLSDMAADGRIRHQQQWGEMGIDIAARSNGPRCPIRIGERTYAKGLGHHANGEVRVPLDNEYTAFKATLGIHWQGGERGSAGFRILVDGKLALEHGPVSDSDPARDVEIPLTGARELLLVARDGGNGISCDMTNWAEARLLRDARFPVFAPPAVVLNGRPAPPASSAACGLSLIADPAGPQLAIAAPTAGVTFCLEKGETAALLLPVECAQPTALRVAADAVLMGGGEADVELSVNGPSCRRRLAPGVDAALEASCDLAVGKAEISLRTSSSRPGTVLRLHGLRYEQEGKWRAIPLRFTLAGGERFPPPPLPEYRPGIVRTLVEWDWRMQDGIGTQRAPADWMTAVEKTLDRGDRLVAELGADGVSPGDLAREWNACRAAWRKLTAQGAQTDADGESLWRRTHEARRQIVFANPLLPEAPLLFAKRVPGAFSHQLTQYYGRCARPGGGLFVLEDPGVSMRCREVTDGMLPQGSYQHPELSYDGRRVLFAYCRVESARDDWRTSKRTYHLYEAGLDGTGPRQITDGPFDDFAPRYLPDGGLIFISTRRGGFHRCGRGPCPVYTLTTADHDGANLRVISCHETHEWDPAVLNDGRVIYTRWDYVDRSAVHYQHLWTTRPDGTNPSAFFGNCTLNPVGIWEPRPVPGSRRVMATAAAHHAMTAGSIILLDTAAAMDGLAPITRLTPDVLFPESEFPVQRWSARAVVASPPAVPVEEQRWPGHCYRTPYPLSETVFLAAYSFDPLIGEPHANTTNMFGLYVVDAHGNKELLYRDPNISSLWPIPVRPRPRPPALPSVHELPARGTGTFIVQGVYWGDPSLPEGEENRIRRLRIVQVLPKTTPNANSPRVGLANASPGKQVLGTVPVEPDGSAHFLAPADVPLHFQALDKHGRAVQTMRSLTYLQPGETTSCIGCHESRHTAPPPGRLAQALARPASGIAPGPDGSKPLSFPLLVQPVLDRHCVRCHQGKEAPDGVQLTGEPEHDFTVSYNRLVARVRFSAWGGGDFRKQNCEPLTHPDVFGSRTSKLMAKLLEGHKEVQLDSDDVGRLVTWMDANALFYGTFNPEDQARQRRGERIEGPALE